MALLRKKSLSRMGMPQVFRKKKIAFTLIEILVATGISSIIGGVTILAINPRENIGKAYDAERLHNANQVQKGLLQRLLANEAVPSEGSIPYGEENAKQICREGMSGVDNTCVNFDALVSEDIIVSLPVDRLEPCPSRTGYAVYRNETFFTVKPVYLGVRHGDDIDTDCPPSTKVITTIDTDSIVGQFPSIAVPADGLPAISYFYYHNTTPVETHLRFTKCGNASCSENNSIASIDTSGDLGYNTGIAISPSDGFPIISHYDSGANFVKSMKCGDASCLSGNVAAYPASDYAYDSGQYTDIAIGSDGLPVITHYDSYANQFKLLITHCANNDCTSGSNLTTVLSASADSSSHFTSIAIGSDGYPLVVTYRTDSMDLYFYHCTNITCSSSQLATIDSAGQVGQYPSIAISSDGYAVIAYYDGTNGDLKIAKCGNVACTSPTITTVDSTGNVGQYTSIAVPADGFPVVSYYDATNGDLKVLKCGDAACSSGNTITTVDSTGNVGSHTSIAISTDGFPVIAYNDEAANDLKVVKCADATCEL